MAFKKSNIILNYLMENPSGNEWDFYPLYQGRYDNCNLRHVVDGFVNELIRNQRISKAGDKFTITDNGRKYFAGVLADIARNAKPKTETPAIPEPKIIAINRTVDLDAQRAECYSKARYSDEQHARKIMLKCLQARPNVPLRIYGCYICGGYHLTHTRQRKYHAVSG